MIPSIAFRALKKALADSQTHLRVDEVGAPGSVVTAIILVAIRILESHGLLYLFGQERVDAKSIQALVIALYQRSIELCPDAVGAHIAEPDLNFGISAFAPFRQDKLNLLLAADGALGWAYQFLCATTRKDAQISIQSANKNISKDHLIAFTQLYTPEWIADFIIANTVYKLSRRSEAHTIGRFEKWLLEKNDGIAEGNAKRIAANRLSILDPACGAGNFLIPAFELSFQNLIAEGWDTPSALELARSLVVGADVDRMALWVSSLGLMLKAAFLASSFPTKPFELFLVGIGQFGAEEELLGSIFPEYPTDHVLSRKYSAVITNPPYVGRKLMNRELKTSLRKYYPECHHDLAAAFVARNVDQLESGGAFGVITQSSILTLPSYRNFRESLFQYYSVPSVVTLGSGVFPLQGGDKVNSAVIFVERNDSGADTKFLNLSRLFDKAVDLAENVEHLKSGVTSKFRTIQRTTLRNNADCITHDFPEILFQIIQSSSPLSQLADVRQGLATSDNQRFIKSIDDVSPEQLGTIWQPYVKGAGSDRWESPIRYAVNWEDNGREIKEAVAIAYPYLNGNIKWVVKNEQFYFRPGLCFSFVNTKNLAVRRLPAGCIFDVAASALFVHDPQDENFLLGYLNSSIMSAIAKAINPTINMQVGDIKKLPIFSFTAQQKQEISSAAVSCCLVAKEIGVLGKKQSESPDCEMLWRKLIELESFNDEIVAGAIANNYSLTDLQIMQLRSWVFETYQPSGASRNLGTEMKAPTRRAKTDR